MTDRLHTSKISRRKWVSIAGASTLAIPMAAQQPANPSRDYLAEQRESNSRALAELERFELQTADEPIFRLVVR